MREDLSVRRNSWNMYGTAVLIISAIPYVFTCRLLRKKLKAVLGYDPIRNRIGEGYQIGGEER